VSIFGGARRDHDIFRNAKFCGQSQFEKEETRHNSFEKVGNHLFVPQVKVYNFAGCLGKKFGPERESDRGCRASSPSPKAQVTSVHAEKARIVLGVKAVWKDEKKLWNKEAQVGTLQEITIFYQSFNQNLFLSIK